MKKTVILFSFSHPDFNDGIVNDFAIKSNVTIEQLINKIKKILKEFYNDSFTSKEFKQYWEDSDFENSIDFDWTWTDCNDVVFSCKEIVLY